MYRDGGFLILERRGCLESPDGDKRHLVTGSVGGRGSAAILFDAPSRPPCLFLASDTCGSVAPGGKRSRSVYVEKGVSRLVAFCGLTNDPHDRPS